MMEIPGKQSNTINDLKNDLRVRMHYLQILEEIKDREKTIRTLQTTIDNFKKGSFKPPKGDISPWKTSLATHDAAVKQLKENAETIRRTMHTKSQMLDIFSRVIDEVGIIHEFDN